MNVTQRKIRHLLTSEGDGASFRYRAQLAQPFDLDAPVIVTEKVDGSTMQAHGGKPFKRYDRFSKGDPRKHTATEEERYELRACSRENPAEKWYLDAFEAHALGFENAARVWPGWIYFEALGAKIGARYPGLAPTIRVFDIADNEGTFYPFPAAQLLAEDVGLPIVASLTTTFGDLSTLFAQLAQTTSAIGQPPAYEIEGWVLRQGDLVAKIRVADLRRIV